MRRARRIGARFAAATGCALLLLALPAARAAKTGDGGRFMLRDARVVPTDAATPGRFALHARMQRVVPEQVGARFVAQARIKGAAAACAAGDSLFRDGFETP
jgi:hypothetical protein